MEFEMTNNGLRIWTHLARTAFFFSFLFLISFEDYIFDIQAYDRSTHTKWKRRGIGLRFIKTPTGFVRCCNDQLLSTMNSDLWATKPSETYVRRDVTLAAAVTLPKRSFLKLWTDMEILFDHTSNMDVRVS